MRFFGSRSPWQGSPFLGQGALILGPSSWGAGMLRLPAYQEPVATPPFWGEWGTVNPDGELMDSGREGPFETIEEAFNAATTAASNHGATKMPLDGFAQAKDSRGVSVGPMI